MRIVIAQAPATVIASRQGKGERPLAFQAGANACLGKPASADAVMAYARGLWGEADH